ncbi:MAG: hypothetical protein WD065_20170, partial [Planctomycetaceae bacterium]
NVELTFSSSLAANRIRSLDFGFMETRLFFPARDHFSASRMTSHFARVEVAIFSPSRAVHSKLTPP